MQKILIIILSFSIVVSMAGCKSQNRDTDMNNSVISSVSDKTSSTPDEDKTVTDNSTISEINQDNIFSSNETTRSPSNTSNNSSTSSSSNNSQNSSSHITSNVASNDDTPNKSFGVVIVSFKISFDSNSVALLCNANHPNGPISSITLCCLFCLNIVFLFLFTDDSESHWDSDSLSKFESSQTQKALTYLEDKASQYGKTLNFISKSYSVIGEDNTIYSKSIIKDANSNNMSYDALENICENMGYGTSDGLFADVRKEYPNCEIIPIILLNKDGTSYARGVYTPESTMPEHCIIFTRNLGVTSAPFLPGNRASTIAHEILHLYGAEDFYNMEGRSALASKYYPSDIMYYVDGFVNRNKIGDFTAYTIGWTDDVPDICNDENWWN